jgi:PAS domain S-box-containing protein
MCFVIDTYKENPQNKDIVNLTPSALSPNPTLERILVLAQRGLGVALALTDAQGIFLAGDHVLASSGGLRFPVLHLEWDILGFVVVPDRDTSRDINQHGDREALEGEMGLWLAMLGDVLALQHENHWCQTAFGEAAQPMFSTDLEGKVRRINKGAVQLFRSTSEEVLGRSFQHFPALSNPMLDVAFEDVAAGKEARPLELPCFRADGTVAMLRFSLTPMHNAAGVQFGVVFCADDLLVSLGDSAEREVLRRLYAGVLDHLPLELSLIDAEERYLYLSPALVPDAALRRRLYGLTVQQAAEVTQRNPEQVEYWRTLLEQLRHNPARVQWEETIAKADGSNAYVLRSMQGVVASSGKLEMFVIYSLDITARRIAELEREEADLIYKQLFENIPFPIYRSNLEGRMMRANPALIEFNGYGSEAEMIADVGVGMGSWYVDQDHSKVLRVLNEGGQVLALESEVYRFRTRERVWVSESAWTVRDEAGEILYFEGVVQDITARKLAEQEREVALGLFQDLFDHATEGIYRMEPTGHLLWANPALLRLNACANEDELREDMEPSTADWYVHPLRQEEFMQQLERDGQLSDFESEVTIVRTGERKWITESCRLVRDAQGYPLYIEGTIQDISARKQAEADVQREKRLFEQVIQTSPHPIMVRDAKGIIVLINNALMTLNGADTEGFWTGQIPPHPNNIPEFAISLQNDQTMLQAGSTMSFEEVYTTLNGDEHIFSTIKAPLEREDGSVQVLVIATDITEFKRLDKLKDDFVATVSHELRTPLTSINGALGLLSAGVLGEISPMQRPMLDIAQHNSERLISLVNDLLDIQKLEGGGMALVLEPLELSSVLHKAISDLRPYAQNLGVSVQLEAGLEAGNSAWLVNGDFGRLVQVMSNLLSNACKFSNTGQAVVVRLRQQDGRAVVEVEDRGAGIPENFKDKIFQKFAQADNTSTRAKGGTGLGLAISKAIVEKHGGILDFVSLEQGTRFHFELPLIEAVETHAETV